LPPVGGDGEDQCSESDWAIEGRSVKKHAEPGRDHEWAKYFDELRMRARQGDAEAEEALGAWYLEGKKSRTGATILPRSPGRAIQLLTRSSDAGSEIAMFRLGVCFDFGEGVRRNPSKAAALYRRAARRGIGVAAANLAITYRARGNWRLAERWFRKAIDLGETDAALEIGRMALERRWTWVKVKPLLERLRRLAKTGAEPEAPSVVRLLEQAYSRRGLSSSLR
jgi:uncharacterized protein